MLAWVTNAYHNSRMINERNIADNLHFECFNLSNVLGGTWQRMTPLLCFPFSLAKNLVAFVSTSFTSHSPLMILDAFEKVCRCWTLNKGCSAALNLERKQSKCLHEIH